MEEENGSIQSCTMPTFGEILWGRFVFYSSVEKLKSALQWDVPLVTSWKEMYIFANGKWLSLNLIKCYFSLSLFLIQTLRCKEFTWNPCGVQLLAIGTRWCIKDAAIWQFSHRYKAKWTHSSWCVTHLNLKQGLQFSAGMIATPLPEQRVLALGGYLQTKNK